LNVWKLHLDPEQCLDRDPDGKPGDSNGWKLQLMPEEWRDDWVRHGVPGALNGWKQQVDCE